MISRGILMLVLTAAFSGVSPAATNPFLGKWNITATSATGSYPYWLEVQEENGRLAGSFLNRSGSVRPLPEIAIEGEELVFSLGGNPNRPEAPKPVHRARIEDGKLVGALITGNDRIPWIGVRPPAWGERNANAAHRYGPPVSLFNGQDLSGWGVQNPNRPIGWTVEDGIMVNEAKANNLVSTQTFKDFRLFVEYKLEPKSNSGFYLRGRYELQVLDDAGTDAGPLGHMSIYSRLAPAVNASRPAGEWQTMEAVIAGNRTTVVLNGRKVHDNQVIEGITGGALDSNEGTPGPIMIQGDHGRIWIRKIVVTPIL